MGKGHSERALAIARGLIVRKMAKAPQNLWAGGFIKLFAGNDVHFWVRHDGESAFRVSGNGDVEDEMSAAFASEMVQAGTSPEGRIVELVARTPPSSDDPSMYDSYDTPYRPPGWVNPI